MTRDDAVRLFGRVQFVEPGRGWSLDTVLRRTTPSVHVPEEAVTISARHISAYARVTCVLVEFKYAGVDDACGVQRGSSVEVQLRPLDYIGEKRM